MGDLKETLPLVLHGSLMLLDFSLGLASTVDDATYLFKRPRLLLRAVTAIDLVVPVTAVVLVILMPLPQVVKIGIVLMAISPLPPLVPAKQLKLGVKTPYVCGLYVAVLLLAIVIVPLTMVILTALFSSYVVFPPPAMVARQIFLSVLLPLALGMAVRRFRPAFAERAAGVVAKLATGLLVLACVPFLIVVWPAVSALIGDGTALTMALVIGVGLLAGHLLGGPEREDRTALAMASAMRHPGLALLIAKVDFHAEHVGPVVLLFLIVGMIVAFPYQVWTRRRALGEPAATVT